MLNGDEENEQVTVWMRTEASFDCSLKHPVDGC